MNLSENPNDRVQYLIQLKGSLYAFADNYISKILPAESIDPRNLHPETRHSNQKLYSIGCANSWVARSIIQTKQLLDSVILYPEINKQIILDHAWTCTELLLNCEAAHYKIYQNALDLMPKCDAIIEEGKKGIVIPTLPQVEDLESSVAIFLGNAKRFLEKTHEYLCLFFKAPNSESNFRAYREWLTENKPDKQGLIKLLENDKDWIKQVASLRNAHEMNHAEKAFNLEIANFKLYPGNKCSTPGWRYDFSRERGKVQNEFSDIVTDMGIHLTNLLTFYEELLIFCLLDSSDKNYKYEIYKKLPEDINKKCPTIYFVSIKKGT